MATDGRYSDIHRDVLWDFFKGEMVMITSVIGVSNTKTSKFLILSAISTLVLWVTYIALGYIFGEVLNTKFSHIEHIEKHVIGILLLVGLVIFILYGIRNKKKRPEVRA